MADQIFNDFILSVMLLHQLRHRFVTIATTELCPPPPKVRGHICFSADPGRRRDSLYSP